MLEKKFSIMKYVKLFENWDNSDDSITEDGMIVPPDDEKWDENWSDSVEDDEVTEEPIEDEDYPDDEWDSNWSDS